MAFLCRNDPLPTEGDVIGLAAPSLQRQLDELEELDELEKLDQVTDD
jgi:hypothetical protein